MNDQTRLSQRIHPCNQLGVGIMCLRASWRMSTRQSWLVVLALALSILQGSALAEVWETSLVSRQAPGDTGNADSSLGSLTSANGRHVVIGSRSSNLMVGQQDNNNRTDVFLFDRVSNSMTLISGALGSSSLTANGDSYPSAISADGSWVLFQSDASNVISGVTDSNGSWDVFLYERSSGTTTLVSRALGSATSTPNNQSIPTAISADGNWVLFYSGATNLVSGVTDINAGTWDVFLFERSSGTTTLVSRALGSATTTANGNSISTALSADGNQVLFRSTASNVISGLNDSNSSDDVFLFDRTTGTTTLVSRALGSATTTANNSSFPTAISADGNQVLFSSRATNVISGVTDSNSSEDVFLFDRATGTTTLVSRALGMASTTANNRSSPRAISTDGQWVLFSSAANNVQSGVTDSNGTDDVFLFERSSGTTTLVSRSLGSPTATADGFSSPGAISADGNWVLFQSSAANLISGLTDSNGTGDVFLFDRTTGITTLVSRALGSATTTPNGYSFPAAISADGQWVLFQSGASNVLNGVSDNNATDDAFLFERGSGTTRLISRALRSASAAANSGSIPTAISADGNWILFQSDASNVLSGGTDSNGARDVFLFERSSGTTTLVSRALGSPTITANGPGEFNFEVQRS